jgi:hypothetical protein
MPRHALASAARNASKWPGRSPSPARASARCRPRRRAGTSRARQAVQVLDLRRGQLRRLARGKERKPCQSEIDPTRRTTARHQRLQPRPHLVGPLSGRRPRVPRKPINRPWPDCAEKSPRVARPRDRHRQIRRGPQDLPSRPSRSGPPHIARPGRRHDRRALRRLAGPARAMAETALCRRDRQGDGFHHRPRAPRQGRHHRHHPPRPDRAVIRDRIRDRRGLAAMTRATRPSGARRS